jgi:hypothetical protein
MENNFLILKPLIPTLIKRKAAKVQDNKLKRSLQINKENRHIEKIKKNHLFLNIGVTHKRKKLREKHW